MIKREIKNAQQSSWTLACRAMSLPVNPCPLLTDRAAYLGFFNNAGFDEFVDLNESRKSENDCGDSGRVKHGFSCNTLH